MKKKTLSRKNYLRDKMFFIIVALSIAAVSFSVYAVLESSRTQTDAYYLSNASCSQQCRPGGKPCPSTAPFCVKVKSDNLKNPVYRCSVRADTLWCQTDPVMTPFPTSIYPSKFPTLLPEPSCPPYLDSSDMPCYVSNSRTVTE